MWCFIDVLTVLLVSNTKQKKHFLLILSCCVSKLRSYPIEFGRAIADITIKNMEDTCHLFFTSMKSNVVIMGQLNEQWK